MYIQRISARDFRLFDRLEVELLVPGRKSATLDNINVLVGENGSGKSSFLRAIALAVLGEAAHYLGYYSEYNIRRTAAGEDPRIASLTLEAALHRELHEGEGSARLESQFTRKGSVDRITSSYEGPLAEWRLEQILSSEGPSFFVAGYAASRRVEKSANLTSGREGAAERYLRVKGLFDEHTNLMPLGGWLPESSRRDEGAEILNRLTPMDVQLVDKPKDGETEFLVNGVQLPFSQLADGYKGLIGWVSDLLYRLDRVAPSDMELSELPGVALVDEVDLYLHPRWQQELMRRLSAALPRLQFVVTTHSPLILGSLERANVHFLETDGDRSVIRKPEVGTFGLSADQILGSRWFGLESTRDPVFRKRLAEVERRALDGDAGAAQEMHRLLARGGENVDP